MTDTVTQHPALFHALEMLLKFAEVLGRYLSTTQVGSFVVLLLPLISLFHRARAGQYSNVCGCVLIAAGGVAQDLVYTSLPRRRF